MIDIGLYSGYILLIGATLIAALMPLLHALQTPGKMAKTFASLGLLLVVFILSYFVSGSEVTDEYVALGVSDPSSSRFIGAGLIMLYVVFGAAMVGIVVSEISKALK